MIPEHLKLFLIIISARRSELRCLFISFSGGGRGGGSGGGMFGGGGGGGFGNLPPIHINLICGDGQNYESQTGHAVFMRGLPFRADEDAVREVGSTTAVEDYV